METVSENTEQAGQGEAPRKSISTIPMELLWAALCMAILAALAVTLLSDGKARFQFDQPAPAKESPSATPAAAAQAAASAAPIVGAAASRPATSAPVNVEATGGIQSLFVAEQQGRAENRPTPSLFAPDVDYAQPRRYQNLKEQDLGRMYVSEVKVDKQALAKVARLGGFRSPEVMASAFGYGSVQQMVDSWEQRISMSPQFQADNFGTNATPVVPRW